MRVESRPVDVIVAAVNALKVKSCWIDAPDAAENRWDPYRPRPASEQFRSAPQTCRHSRRRLRIPVSWPHRLSPKRAPRAASRGIMNSRRFMSDMGLPLP
jgi:hypothetical protein